MARKRHKAVFTNGKVHVLKAQCDTCIFRPGDLMSLEPGRVDQMVKEAVRKESCIVCHSTLNTICPAICRGFFDRYKTAPLQIAVRLGYIDEI
jgi:hypothetical protein